MLSSSRAIERVASRGLAMRGIAAYSDEWGGMPSEVRRRGHGENYFNVLQRALRIMEACDG